MSWIVNLGHISAVQPCPPDGGNLPDAEARRRQNLAYRLLLFTKCALTNLWS